MWADEPRVSSHNCLSQFLFSSRLLFFFFSFFGFVHLPGLFFPAANSVHHPACSFLQPHLSEALRWWKVFYQVFFSFCFFFSLYPSAGFFSFCPSLFFPSHVTLLYLTFLISSSFSLPHTLSPPSLSLSLSLCGRVVINPYFIAGEFLSPCRADSSPRSKTLLGPNPILPPSITPSLPPSGPDYWESGGVVVVVVVVMVVGGRCRREASHHYTLGEGREKGRRDGWCTTCWCGGEDGGWRGGGGGGERTRRREEDKWGLADLGAAEKLAGNSFLFHVFE